MGIHGLLQRELLHCAETGCAAYLVFCPIGAIGSFARGKAAWP
jgi:hypothetical protein